MNTIKDKALHWANTFSVCAFFDSNQYPDSFGKFDSLIAAGASHTLSAKAGDAFSQLRSFYDKHKNWVFGLLAYDLKNETEALESRHTDLFEFADLFFFVPQYLISIQGNKINVLIGDDSIIATIEATHVPAATQPSPPIQPRFDRENYISTVMALQEHIKRGDIYEINLCQEFYAEHTVVRPVDLYRRLNQLSPTPFSGFFRAVDHYVISASPERFLCKRGKKILSQPIKGTAKRSTDPEEDLNIQSQLKSSLKEQAENVMIVDLVRNDLTKSAKKGTVQVDELYGAYRFPQVHQLISTVSCELSDEVHIVDAIKNTFPAGSMTGAPKIRAMQLIDQYERSRRGLYSGAMGYIDPNADFDFNVIIRSIVYNTESAYLSFQVGGAITYLSDAHQEYEECLLKASAIIAALNG
ncbi:Isochorismate synthase MenF [compost metagenome]